MSVTSEPRERLLQEAEAFIRTCYAELGQNPSDTESRLREVRQDIARTGSYVHTFEELAHGARQAWRNSNRCIGRLFWESLHVFDCRDALTPEDVAEAVFRHLSWATNGGRIRPAISIFRPAEAERPDGRIRIWNAQVIRYAGYRRPDGGLLGDPDSLRLTELAEQMGWRGAGTPFDVLPLIVSVGSAAPQWFPVPREQVLEVPLAHPEHPGFAELQLKWYAVPFVSNMRLEIGGLSYTAAPFNGWYMGTEIGARNLADANRYNLLPKVAELFGLDTRSVSSLWKDRALVELNVAVLHSYKQAGVSMVDHHTAARQFGEFESRERDAGRRVTGNWTWLIPPMSPATTPIWSQPYPNEIVRPNFFYQRPVWEG